jgi:Glycosyltransferase family 87
MLRKIFLVVIASVLACAMWLWVQRVAIPHQQAESAARDAPRGNLSDLYPRWLGARELLLHGRDPYGEDITREIQIGYYGRRLDPDRPNDPKDQQAFAYPLYVVFLLAPTVTLPFPVVQRILFWLFVFLAGVSVSLWLRALGWQLSASAKVGWILLTLGCFPAIQGIKLQQLSVLVTALIAAFFLALSSRRFVWAGIFLAAATIKPQLVALPVLWLCLWVLGNWRDRQRVLWSFGIASAMLVIAGEILLPGWIHEFRTALANYYQYTGGGKSVLDVVLSPFWGRLASALLVVLLAIYTWQVRRSSEDSVQFQWSFALALAVTLAVIPMFAPYNQLLLVPGLMVIGRSVHDLWAKGPLPRFFVVITAIAVFFPFAGAVLLDVAMLFLPGGRVQVAWGLPFYPSFAIPITILALLLVTRGVIEPESNRQSAIGAS